MVNSLEDLVSQYSHRYGVAASPREKLLQLYNNYVKRRETALLDAVAATAALDALVFSDQVNINEINPQMVEAAGLQWGFNLDSLIEHLESLGDKSSVGVRNELSKWKGKYFEVLICEKLNAGEAVGDIQLGPGQQARLFSSPTHPGSDLEIVNPDGSIAEELQLKATESISYIKGALEKYPDIPIVASDEVADKIADDLILDSNTSNAELKASIQAPVDDILDTPFEELMEAVVPGLPFVLIATAEGTKALVGRQSFEQAVNRSVDRGVKTGASVGVGILLALVDAGLISLPATFTTRLGIDRYRIYNGLSKRLKADISSIRSISGSL